MQKFMETFRISSVQIRKAAAERRIYNRLRSAGVPPPSIAEFLKMVHDALAKQNRGLAFRPDGPKRSSSKLVPAKIVSALKRMDIDKKDISFVAACYSNVFANWRRVASCNPPP